MRLAACGGTASLDGAGVGGFVEMDEVGWTEFVVR
jgi:hypothetical protein